MRIAICVPVWPPTSISANGITTYASHLIPALEEMGHEVVIIANGGDISDASGVNLDEYRRAATLHEKALLKLLPSKTHFDLTSRPLTEAVTNLFAKKKGIDVIEIEESFGYSYAISRLRLLPVVVRLHGPGILTTAYDRSNAAGIMHSRRDAWEGRAIARADLITAPSSMTLNFVRNHYAIRSDNSLVIPNPIKSNITVGQRDLKKILYVGRFDRLKGGDLALQTFSRLSARWPFLSMTFVGADQGIRQADGGLVKFAGFLNTMPESVRSRIDYRGTLSSSEIQEMRSSHGITIVASQYETFPYSVLEAMSSASAIVATSVGGIPEILEHGRNGLLVPSQNVDAMADACHLLLENPKLAVRIGDQARSDCLSRYSPENVARQTVSAYVQAIREFRS